MRSITFKRPIVLLSTTVLVLFFTSCGIFNVEPEWVPFDPGSDLVGTWDTDDQGEVTFNSDGTGSSTNSDKMGIVATWFGSELTDFQWEHLPASDYHMDTLILNYVNSRGEVDFVQRTVFDKRKATDNYIYLLEKSRIISGSFSGWVELSR